MLHACILMLAPPIIISIKLRAFLAVCLKCAMERAFVHGEKVTAYNACRFYNQHCFAVAVFSGLYSEQLPGLH